MEGDSVETGSYYLKGEERFGALSSRFYSRLSGLHYWKYYRTVVKEVERYMPGSVLDVGCGPGDIMVHLASENPGMKLSGIDPSSGMVRAANRNAMKAGLGSRITVREGSSRHVPFEDNFDMVISTMSFHHWKEWKKSLENLSRHITEGGRIAIFDLDRSQYPGKLPFFRVHSLSEQQCQALEVSGMSGSVRHIAGSGLILFELRRIH